MVILVRVHCGITSAHSGNTSACTVVLIVCVHTMVILVRVHCGITSAHSGNTSVCTVVLLVCVCVHSGITSMCVCTQW